ncbi:protein phosphatase 2C domain-containing protein [Glycomyces sp. A-F 0318]|uniref:protein phosphatase 2C domain-containing protein n=1 Tax=Glycomyces amatae TaxID=2881355 RepID=UPI001E339CBD|nr:protein phosphatase 2C domain-containing protein [Glycomyces amatae]MCD0445246.1 protein phosphatase 2C domain-containing protein [Glycomyces amatae]
MTEGKLDLVPPPAPPAWGDRAEPWVPDTVGRRAKAAEAAWKLDPDPDFPDTVLDRGRLGDIEVLACAARGSKHRFEGTARQDAAIARAAAGSWALAAVADGVGSVPDSQQASTAAVQWLLIELTRRLETGEAEPHKMVRAAFGEVNRRLVNLGGPKTTLTAAGVEALPGPDGRYRSWVAAVGDSPVYFLRDGRLVAVFDLEREDEFGTATDAMPDRDLRNRLRLRSAPIRPGDALALVSDGIGDLLGARSEEPKAYFAERWGAAPNPVDFMRHVQIRSRGFDDDRSAAVLWAAPGPTGQDAPALRDAARPSAAHDVEIRAGRLRGLEVRAVSSRGLEAAREGRRRRARTVLFERAGRLVAITAAPTGVDATADHVGPWVAAVREAVEGFPPDHPSSEWMPNLWSLAVRAFDATPGARLDEVATAVLCAEPSPGGAVDYELALAGPVSAAIFGAGIHQELGTIRAPEHRWGTGPGEVPCRVHVDRLTPDQGLLLTVGVDPARFARLPERPGPLEAYGVLEGERAEEDQLALVLWGER